jgi:hypothetical protein
MNEDDRERGDRERQQRDPAEEEEDDEALWGQVADPLDSEEEAQAAYEAIWALHLPPATDEQVARARWLAEVAERNERRIAALIRQERLQRRYEAEHGQGAQDDPQPAPEEPTEP